MKKKILGLMLSATLGASASNVFSCRIVPQSNQLKIYTQINNDRGKIEDDVENFSTTGTTLPSLTQEVLELLTYTKDKYTSKKDNDNALNYFGESALYQYSVEGLKNSTNTENWNDFYNLLNGSENSNTFISAVNYNLADSNYSYYNTYKPSDPKGSYVNKFKTFAIDKDKDNNIIIPDSGKIDDFANLDTKSDKDPDIATWKTNFNKNMMLIGSWKDTPQKYQIIENTNNIMYENIDTSKLIFYTKKGDKTSLDDTVIYYKPSPTYRFEVTITNEKKTYTATFLISNLLEKFGVFTSAKNLLLIPTSYTFDGENDAYDNNAGVLKNIKISVDSVIQENK
ncbi:hypothetical protein [Spiroplasma endosymbiont of Aspidapion aeneum]|uniref:hypothetical protein n=1 Tax=Spiroplasma endosymbiont of Aspidapion aeneum TaxID=3066276 RepID=UPI00313DCD1A